MKSRIKQKIGYEPYSWAVLLYDAFWVSALTRIDKNYSTDIENLKSTFEAVLENYSAVTGAIILNENSDRESYSCDFWGATQSQDQYQWTKAFTHSE